MEPLSTKTEKPKVEDSVPASEIDSDDPNLTAPLPRYNAMLAVLRNTLYMFVSFPAFLMSPLMSAPLAMEVFTSVARVSIL
jgi:hypothetical protein